MNNIEPTEPHDEWGRPLNEKKTKQKVCKHRLPKVCKK
jgi:hypothetical protein